VCVCFVCCLCVQGLLQRTRSYLQSTNSLSKFIREAMENCEQPNCPLHPKQGSLWKNTTRAHGSQGRPVFTFKGVELRSELTLDHSTGTSRGRSVLLTEARRLQCWVPEFCFCDVPSLCPNGFHVPFTSPPRPMCSSKIVYPVTESASLPPQVSLPAGPVTEETAMNTPEIRMAAALHRITEKRGHLPTDPKRYPLVGSMLNLGEHTLMALELAVDDAVIREDGCQ
jgi:hypothetical protein